ncbi:MAG: MerR family transcriptional regulator [Deltaproteobacteria bacterium]|nr:MerR family transcriptional regulator [Deltaproteobacteria bacterium]
MATGRPGRRHLRIGELERALGVTRDQVHHYVELGLVPAPEKSAATLAWYGPEHQAAVARVRAIRDAGGSLSQAQRWLAGPLAHAGPEDCATLTRWVIGDRAGGALEAGRTRARLPLEAVVAMIDAGLARIDPDALVSGAALDPTPWLDELAARWVEREEQARVTVAGEALEAAASAKLAPWLPIASARVEGGALRAAALDQALSADEPGAHEERARLGLMVPVPTGWLPEHGGWSAVARGAAAMRSRKWIEAGTALSTAPPGAPGATLAAALGWCAGAMAAARAGDGVLGVVARLGELRAIDASAAADLVERLRLRWTLAVTWLALPPRWGSDRPGVELGALMAELATVPSDDRRRATGELDVVEANAGLALSAWRLRAGDRAGSAEAARGVVAFGGAAAQEAARRVRRASRAM